MTSRTAFFALVLAGACMAPAQQPLDTGTSSEVALRLSPEELESLLAPVALHPDALIALVLPAATNPTEIVLAARRLAVKADPASFEAEPWDDSVKALARYPDMLTWMDENLDWTRQVGAAFLDQPADVMNAVQRLRAQARAAGTLADTPQQQVVVVEEHIRIVPARPDVIYVPRYDPAIVYVSRPYYYPRPVSFFSFSVGYAVGSWLAYDFDWPRRTFWIVPPPYRVTYWHERRDWRLPVYHPGKPGFRDHRWHTWHPRTVPTRSPSYVDNRRHSYAPSRSSHFAPNLSPPPSRSDAGRSTRDASPPPPRRDSFAASPATRTSSASWTQSQPRIDRTVRPSTERERNTPSAVSRVSPPRPTTPPSALSQTTPPAPRRDVDVNRDNRPRPSTGQWSSTQRSESSWRPGATSSSRSSESSQNAVRSRSFSSGGNEGNRSYSSRSSSDSRPSAFRSSGSSSSSSSSSRGSSDSGRSERSRR